MWSRIALFFSSGFYSGFIMSAFGKPGAGGGIFGSLIGLTFSIMLFGTEYALIWCYLLTMTTLLLGILVVPTAEKYMVQKFGARKKHTGNLVTEDFNETNIDEIHGQLVAALPIHLNPDLNIEHFLLLHLAAFILFRIFDAYKIGYAKKIEVDPRLTTGWQIMLDDTMAGMYVAFLIAIPVCISIGI